MSTLSRGLPALFTLLIAACASPRSGDSGGLAPAVTNPGYVSRYGENVNAYIPADQGVVSAVVKATPVDAFNTLVKVFEDGAIPVTQMDAKAGTVGNPDFKVYRRLMGQRLSYFLNCGEGLTGPTANSARIEMNISGKVVQVGDGQVRIDMLLGAIAHPTQGTSTESAACNSSQRLEREILDRVQKRLSSAMK